MNEYGKQVKKTMDTYMNNPDSIDKEISDIQNATHGVEVRGALAAGVKKSFDKSVEAETISENAQEQVDNIQSQVNQLVVEGDSSVEAAQARVDSEGNTYSTLKERLDDKETEFSSQLAQKASKIDFVDKRNFLQMAKDFTVDKSKTPLYKINGDRNVSFLFPTTNKEYIQYRFEKDTNDDFIKQREMSIFEEKLSRENYSNSSHTLAAATTSTPYATVIGTTLSHTFTGVGIDVLVRHDDRGGIWRVSIDGTHIKDISTHSNGIPDSQKLTIAGFPLARHPIKNDLSSGSHTITLEFIGSDPNHPPTGGTPRGWIAYNANTGTEGMETFYITTSGLSEKVRLANDSSNKEFAFAVRQAGSSVSSNWFPEHNNIGTAFVGNTGFQRLLIDDKEITNYSRTDYLEFNEARLTQVLELKHSEDTQVRAKLFMSTVISGGVVKYSAKITFYLATQIVAGHVNMLPASTVFGNQLVTSQNNRFSTLATDGSFTYIDEEIKSTEYVFTSNDYPDYFIGVKMDDPATTMRLGESNRGRLHIQHRDSNIQKLYPQVFDYYTADVNESFVFSGTFFVGKVALAKELI